MQSPNLPFNSERASSETPMLAHQHPARGAGQQPNEAPQDSQMSWRWPFTDSMYGFRCITFLDLQPSPLAC
jgi:hypothetical protein